MLVYRLRSLSSVVLLLSVMIIQRFLDSLFCQEINESKCFFFLISWFYLGHTLAEISAEKAGIFKVTTRSFCVASVWISFLLICLCCRVEFMLLQCDEAMSVLDEKAFRIGGKWLYTKQPNHETDVELNIFMICSCIFWFVVVSSDL